jgi:hypothetical protein
MLNFHDSIQKNNCWDLDDKERQSISRERWSLDGKVSVRVVDCPVKQCPTNE